MIQAKRSIIVDTITRIMVPFIQIFAFYVIFHGHYSPGGGFQGGALLAGSILLQRVVLGAVVRRWAFPPAGGFPSGPSGSWCSWVRGSGRCSAGDNYLQYDHLPFGLSADMLRNWGILLVEIGVAFAVMGTLVSIYDDLVQLEPRAPDAEMHSAGEFPEEA